MCNSTKTGLSNNIKATLTLQSPSEIMYNVLVPTLDKKKSKKNGICRQNPLKQVTAMEFNTNTYLLANL
jgi:hypothetical protein